MAQIAVGDLAGAQDDGDIGGVELGVDHRAVTDPAAKAKVAFDERRQAEEGLAGIEGISRLAAQFDETSG